MHAHSGGPSRRTNRQSLVEQMEVPDRITVTGGDSYGRINNDYRNSVNKLPTENGHYLSDVPDALTVADTRVRIQPKFSKHITTQKECGETFYKKEINYDNPYTATETAAKFAAMNLKKSSISPRKRPRRSLADCVDTQLIVDPKSDKKSMKTPTRPIFSSSGSSAEEEKEVLTPTTVDDGEMRKIKRLRDGELKCELNKYGISPAGPLDPRTRKLYEKKLLIERRKISSRGYSPDADVVACAGEFHGSTKSWNSITKAEYGTYLLDRALATLKVEGIRYVSEKNLPDTLYPYVNNRRGGGGRTPKTPK
ncbi:hypothetical protein CAEBREN_12809 [Caenorhabditis brenneri]|uniref:LEM domain-containing protein n=1 Tax=Caenorhabditis brenneri TaxID=135651 RepID=G0P6E9_CAEBE|nr:hypothetical protein CAEBREN_12809 [Caenorhabditis brenneri]